MRAQVGVRDGGGGRGWVGVLVLESSRILQLIWQRRSVSRSHPTPPPPTNTAATAPPALAPTLEAQTTMSAMPESLTFSMTHPLLSARRSHRRHWPIDDRGVSERSQVILEEVASQLTPDTPMEDAPFPEDTCLCIMTNTFNQRLGLRPEKVYQGIGNANHRETGASSSTSISGQVASLAEKVAELEQQVAVQHKHIATQFAHIATQEAHIATQESKMAQIITALQLSSFNIPTATPPLTTSTSQAPT
ncbi:hypothetical protein DVH24_007841 [Malus domestica]|uniref:Uncharacterized protein n=1 Tax=Malus domestica TaxID=3750 RepID=A0A498JQS3_MALDO|nr:hypothetical protein DVH24_007841 [Malus domestica]